MKQPSVHGAGAYQGRALALITRFNETPASYPSLTPHLPRHKIDGVGHWLHLDAPDVVNREIDAFLDGDQRGAVSHLS